MRSSADVELAKRSRSVFKWVSKPPFSDKNPTTYPQVSLGGGEGGITVGTFDGSSTLLADVFGMSTILLGKTKYGFNGLLIWDKLVEPCEK